MSAGGCIEPGTVVGEAFVVGRRLGSGATGIVVEATDRARGGAFALKIMRPELVSNSRCVKRFTREARAASAIESEHAVKIFDVGALPDGRPFIVMELLVGIDLEKLLAARGRVTLAESFTATSNRAISSSRPHRPGIGFSRFSISEYRRTPMRP